MGSTSVPCNEVFAPICLSSEVPVSTPMSEEPTIFFVCGKFSSLRRALFPSTRSWGRRSRAVITALVKGAITETARDNLVLRKASAWSMKVWWGNRCSLMSATESHFHELVGCQKLFSTPWAPANIIYYLLKTRFLEVTNYKPQPWITLTALWEPGLAVCTIMTGLCFTADTGNPIDFPSVELGHQWG